MVQSEVDESGRREWAAGANFFADVVEEQRDLNADY
jgi:hypothetical protein